MPLETCNKAPCDDCKGWIYGFLHETKGKKKNQKEQNNATMKKMKTLSIKKCQISRKNLYIDKKELLIGTKFSFLHKLPLEISSRVKKNGQLVLIRNKHRRTEEV